MTVRRIVQAPDPILTEKCHHLPMPLNKWALGLMDDLMETMRSAHCLGLSAPQIGERVRAIVVSPRTGWAFPMMINPVILERNGPFFLNGEGCMSIDQGRARFKVRRAKQIKVCFYNRLGQDHTSMVSGLPAIVIQHEIDHLDGVLISERAKELA